MGFQSSIAVRIFSSKKSVPANKKKEFFTNRDPNKQEVGFIFVWSGSELWSSIKYSELKLKNQKPIADDVLFKAYPMVPCSHADPIWPNGTFKEILLNRLSLTWGWPEVLSMALCSHTGSDLSSSLCPYSVYLYSENQWIRGSFFLTNSSQISVLGYIEENGTE